MSSKIKYLIAILPLFLCSCGTWYYSTLNSRGFSPEAKTYFISSADSLLMKTLEFREYAEVLKQRLNEVGYVEVIPSQADLKIMLDYQLGDTYLEATYTGSSSFSTANVNTNINSNTNANVSIKGTANKNSAYVSGYGNASTYTSVKSTGYSTSYTGTTSTNSYKIPLIVSISAVERVSSDPVWEIIVRDNLSRETQMQSVMPWLILSAQPYFGKSTQGEITTKINNTKEIKERYNLIWPY